MEAKLKREHIDCCCLVYTGTQNREETAESVVPDTMPDVARVVDTSTAIYLRSKTIQDAKILVEGNIQATVLYLAEGDETLYRLDMATGCSFSFDGDGLEEDDFLVALLHINTADVRLLNPRKLLLRADVTGSVSVYRRDGLEYSVQPEEGEPLQMLALEKTIHYVSSVQEKTFVIAEEFSIPPARPALSCLLRYRAGAAVEDTKQVGEKVILQGTAWLEILYAAGEGGAPIRETFTTGFSQILDAPAEQGGFQSVTLMQTSCYVEPLPGAYGANSVSLEMHLTAQSVCRGQREIRYMADAYSTRWACTVETVPTGMVSACRNVTLRETARELLETPEAVGEPVACYADVGTPVREDGCVRVPVCVHAMYMTDRGAASCAVRRLNMELPFDMPDSAVCEMGEAVCNDPYLSAAAGGVELRLPLEVRVTICDMEKLNFVRSVELDTDTPAVGSGAPSLVVVRGGGNSVWTLAKKYCSTPALIEAANPGASFSGGLLLIPRAR